jgi:hypothetical protein
MRHFQILDKFSVDEENGIILLSQSDDHKEEYPQLALRREGVYIAISAQFGPIEIALRPRYDELARLLARLQPVEGLQTTRQVGTSQSYLAIGLRTDGSLVMRPTIVADATGHFSFNLVLSTDLRQALFEWLSVVANSS